MVRLDRVASNSCGEPASISRPCPVRPVTSGPNFHFFGYYDKHVWDRTGSWMLAHQVVPKWDFPTPDDSCVVGAVNTERGEFVPIGVTTAWNWQMGSMLQWCEWEDEPTVAFNERCDRRFVGVIRRLSGERVFEFDRPIYGLACDGSVAFSLDFSRLMHVHPTIGYATSADDVKLETCPSDDGIWRQDLSGATWLIVSLRDLTQFKPAESMQDAIHWITHLAVSPSGKRILFIHRWTHRVEDETHWLHRLYCCRSDGSEPRLLEDGDHDVNVGGTAEMRGSDTYEYEKGKWQISHPLWRSDVEIVCWSPRNGSIHYHLYEVDCGLVRVIGDGTLTENGHMSYSPCGRWLLSDTYPDPVSHEQTLFIFDTKKQSRHDIGTFYANPNVSKHCRCDLHPRWSRDVLSVCIDSIHTNERQMYVVDVSEIVMG